MAHKHIDKPVTITPSAEGCTKTYYISASTHPHAGERGNLTGKCVRFGGTQMAEFKLQDCQHGVDACFVRPSEVTPMVMK